MGPRTARLALLAALLLLAAGAKWLHQPHFAAGGDAPYFLLLAQHVRDGEGLRSNLALYHQGFRSWPHVVNQAPVWPVLLGLSARIVPLEWAATALPKLFAVCALALLYLLGRALERREAGARALPDLGHCAVLLLALNPVFFVYTSLAFSEALAFALAIAALVAVAGAVAGPTLRWAAAAGAFAALAALTRGQMAPLLVAVPGALLLVRSGTQRIAPPAVALAAAAAVFAPWVLFLAAEGFELSLPAVFGFAVVTETPGLDSLRIWVETDGPGDYLADRLEGVRIAFAPGPLSYFASFGLAVLLLPLGLGLAIWRRASWRGALAPGAAPAWATLAAGVGMLVPVHHAHSVLHNEWLFGHRHGLPLLFLLLPAAALAFRRGGVLRVLAAVLLAVGGLQFLPRIAGEIREPREAPIGRSDVALIEWLDAQDPRPVVVALDPKPLAAFSHSFFHWMGCGESGDAVRQLVREAGADYVLVRFYETGCRFARELEPDLSPVRSFGDPRLLMVFAVKGPRGVAEIRSSRRVPFSARQHARRPESIR